MTEGGNFTIKPKYKNEDSHSLIKRFMRKFKKEGILDEILERRYYTKPSVKDATARRRARQAARKAQKEQDSF